MMFRPELGKLPAVHPLWVEEHSGPPFLRDGGHGLPREDLERRFRVRIPTEQDDVC